MKYKNKLFSTFTGKIHLGLFVLLSLIYIPSCHKCELIEQEITLPEENCEGTFYIIKAEPVVPMIFRLYEFAKPVPTPFSSESKSGPHSVPVISLSDIRSNFSSFDSIGVQYVFQHYYTADDQFFNYNLGTSIPTLTLGDPLNDVCPVFHEGRLHNIYVESFSPNDWLYSIGEINPVTGLDGVGLTGNTIITNSPLSAEAMSSVSTGGDLIYFLSGTNLIEYKLSDNSTRHIDIDLTFNQIDNNLKYFGLEYKSDEGVLIAMRNRNNSMGATVTELVSIKVSNSAPVVTSLFDISAQMPAEWDRIVNHEFYSTAFDQCDNTYYITSLNGPPLNTNFIEINLTKNEMKLQVLAGYWYGLEYAQTK